MYSTGRVLYKNNFSGIIPKEIGYLNMLELLDLRNNNLNGTIPMEIGEMLSLKHLYVYYHTRLASFAKHTNS